MLDFSNSRFLEPISISLFEVRKIEIPLYHCLQSWQFMFRSTADTKLLLILLALEVPQLA